MHEKNPKSLQKQHGYKSQKLHKQGYKLQHNIKTQQHNMIIVRRKLVMHMEQPQCDQAKWN